MTIGKVSKSHRQQAVHQASDNPCAADVVYMLQMMEVIKIATYCKRSHQTRNNDQLSPITIQNHVREK